MEIPGVPAFNPMMRLHGEEKVDFFNPIENDSTLVCTESVHDIQDKKKATLLIIETEIKDKASGQLKAKIYTNLFVRGLEGSKNKGKFANPIPEAPKRTPCFSKSETTTPNQAFYYRLCGDRNPLHVDP